MSSFKLKDLQLGNLDAKNELIEDTDDVRNIFINSYVIPPNFNFQKFYERQRYFITGLKGTGKTALLRYISIKLEENPDTYSKFILFKSDLGNKDISAGLSKTDVYDTNNINEEKDYQDLWRWFIYSEIVFFQNKKEIELFQKNEIWKSFSKKVLAIKKSSSLFPRIKNGSLSISIKLFENAEFSAQLGFDKGKDEVKINFKEYIYEIDEIFEQEFSRIPIYSETIDKIVGIVHIKDLLEYIKDQKLHLKMKDLMKDVYFVPATKTLLELLEEFREKQSHMAVIIDEYGGTLGIVTIEDLLEEIVGEIRDEFDQEEENIQQVTDKIYDLKGDTLIEEINSELSVNIPLSEEYDTISGYFQDKLGKVAEISDHITGEGYILKVMEVDNMRVEKIRIVITGKDNEENEDGRD